MHEKMYRGNKLTIRMAVQPIIVCGAGAIGSNITENMLRQGFRTFTVIDFDRVDDHNRHTQVWHKRDIGQLKVNVLKNYVYSIMGVSIDAENKKLDAENIARVIRDSGAIIVDSFDNPPSRQLVYDHCKSRGIDCLHIGLAKDCAEVTWNENYIVPKQSGEDICEYPMARNIIMLSVIVGIESIIHFLEAGKKDNYLISLKDLNISKV